MQYDESIEITEIIEGVKKNLIENGIIKELQGINILRYTLEAMLIGPIAALQLNLTKNKEKPPIETMSYVKIHEKMNEEIWEIFTEIESSDSTIQRKLQEIGDSLAMHVGLLKKVLDEHYESLTERENLA